MNDQTINGSFTTQPNSEQLRVLLVEDEALVSMFLEELISDLGHVIIGSAASAQAAYDIIEKQPTNLMTDLAIVDISLQGASDGIDVAIKLRSEYGVPSVVMSGRHESSVQQRLQQAAPLGYLQKPYTQSDVECALTRARMNLRS